jgi:hypothetical protein
MSFPRKVVSAAFFLRHAFIGKKEEKTERLWHVVNRLFKNMGWQHWWNTWNEKMTFPTEHTPADQTMVPIVAEPWLEVRVPVEGTSYVDSLEPRSEVPLVIVVKTLVKVSIQIVDRSFP